MALVVCSYEEKLAMNFEKSFNIGNENLRDFIIIYKLIGVLNYTCIFKISRLWFECCFVEYLNMQHVAVSNAWTHSKSYQSKSENLLHSSWESIMKWHLLSLHRIKCFVFARYEPSRLWCYFYNFISYADTRATGAALYWHVLFDSIFKLRTKSCVFLR